MCYIIEHIGSINVHPTPDPKLRDAETPSGTGLHARGEASGSPQHSDQLLAVDGMFLWGRRRNEEYGGLVGITMP